MDPTQVMRDAEVRALRLVDHPLPDVLQRLADLAVTVSGADGARLNVFHGGAQHTLVSADQVCSVIPAEDSLCDKILHEHDRQHRVDDIGEDDRFRDTSFARDGTIAAYAASHLRTVNEVTVGTLCVFSSRPGAFDDHAMTALAQLADAVMDVLEARRQHQALRESVVELHAEHQELRRSNEHLAAFAGQVSHDIQGPLSAVMLALQLLQEEPGVEHRDGLLRSALSGARRMRATIASLIDFAVLGGTPDPEDVDLRLVVADVVDDLATRADDSEISIGELPLVHGDRTQVRALLQNLVSNAVKYTAEVPHPRIHVAAEAVADGVRVTVSDNGPGVPPDQRESVFGLLVRGRDAEQGDATGFGIGLATCRRIVDAHGGEIGVEESDAGGARFWFRLPLSLPAAPELLPPAVVEARPVTQLPTVLEPAEAVG